MTRPVPKIAKVMVVNKPGRWGGYKVREITPGGRTLNAYDFSYYDEAMAAARRSAKAHGAELVRSS